MVFHVDFGIALSAHNFSTIMPVPTLMNMLAIVN